ncbi:MAG TPA: ParB/RepB/Spo0J family partition protein [Candidatus Moranbacteria bacterium]|nr:ParB/RepB/Spo0J family partition protein [Candidatus Moranbacteria bacterium]
MAQNYGLGRGLSSLIPQKNKKIDKPEEDFNYFGSKSSISARDDKKDESKSIVEIEISSIIPNPQQPRKFFDEAKLNELADSIKEHGIIQPIVVSKVGGQFEIIAGERRFQAAKIAGLLKVPAIIRETDDQQKLELAIVENIQRQDLNLIEEAKSYIKLTNEFGLTQDEVAKKLGKSRSAVANKIRLLNLPIEIQKALTEGKITEGHAKLLLAIPNPEKQRAFYELIIKNGLTVRQTEDKTKEVSVRTHKRNIAVDPEIKSLEDELTGVLGTKVKIKKSGGGGQIVIEYYSKEELDNILGKIK